MSSNGTQQTHLPDKRGYANINSGVQRDLIEECARCGGRIDTNEPGHYKSPSEIFVHKVCYEEGEPPKEPVLDLSEEYPFMEQIPRQYNCGHYAIGPPRKLPEECPECDLHTGGER